MSTAQYVVPENEVVPFSPFEVYESFNWPPASSIHSKESTSMRLDMSQDGLLEDSPVRYYFTEFGVRLQPRTMPTISKLTAVRTVETKTSTSDNPFETSQDYLQPSPRHFTRSTSTLVAKETNQSKFCEQPTLSLFRTAHLRDYTIVRHIGTGTSGTVYKVKEKSATAYKYLDLALKVINKSQHLGEVECLTREQKALRRVVGSPWFLQLHASFHDTENFYLATEFCIGGDLEAEIMRCGHLSAQRTQFYAAEILLGLEHLHKLGIIHRDIKPSNILLNSSGRIVIADLGLAKVFERTSIPEKDRLDADDSAKLSADTWPLSPFDDSIIDHERVFQTNTPCGSANYMAPEMFGSSAYSFAVDYWSLAITVYDMATGKVPWHHPNVQTLCETILHEPLSFEDTVDVDETTKDFLYRALEKSPQDRLSVKAMKEHAYFSGIDWSNLATHSTLAPHIPDPLIDDSTIQMPSTEPIIQSGSPYDFSTDPFPEYTYCPSPIWAAEDGPPSADTELDQHHQPQSSIAELRESLASSIDGSPHRSNQASRTFINARRLWNKIHLHRPQLRQSNTCALQSYDDAPLRTHHKHTDAPGADPATTEYTSAPSSGDLGVKASKGPHVRRWFRRVCSRASAVNYKAGSEENSP
ncbi:hypothetical protein SERLA73DRAFT_71975 [Serpula lacrymans var. lacrymans S7.3]|uniref:Protein kinase domain-containing protein n=2 Tax=Serpula lacrymans var. lacrymans TaxID=341189 RepID=F8PTH5_SERL3|nr:uncharacterized protein SERLADRAFT_436474 [Serpula lacrymans var. lacrymans S7.9]EGO01003.1 hypothetical protein SERLA73DRAFT_71975 [Serpula lacrymans var. lacrymans S7.3]EGO26668.1 hypothetical protein SERLADRAFT_436474 [Serpula lacrymans var. lacrymans S7.9]